MGTSQSRYRKEIPEEDVLKYTGKTKNEINDWAENQPGVGKNQLAGKIDAGSVGGLGGSAAAGGVGGWGWEGDNGGADRGLKYPPKQPAKALEQDD